MHIVQREGDDNTGCFPVDNPVEKWQKRLLLSYVVRKIYLFLLARHCSDSV